MRNLSHDERRALREQLYADIAAGQIEIPDAVRRMRLIAGMTQREFAERVAELSLPALQRIEAGHTNVQVETLRKVGRRFGLEVGFVRRRG